MTFSRIRSNPKEELPNARPIDRAVNDAGYLWFLTREGWLIDRRLVDPPGKLVDVQGEPTIRNGADNDLAINPCGLCWRKEGGKWVYEGFLGELTHKMIVTDSLEVRGNVSLPIVDGRIVLFRGGRPVGKIKVEPLD